MLGCYTGCFERKLRLRKFLICKLLKVGNYNPPSVTFYLSHFIFSPLCIHYWSLWHCGIHYCVRDTMLC